MFCSFASRIPPPSTTTIATRCLFLGRSVALSLLFALCVFVVLFSYNMHHHQHHSTVAVQLLLLVDANILGLFYWYSQPITSRRRLDRSTRSEQKSLVRRTCSSSSSICNITINNNNNNNNNIIYIWKCERVLLKITSSIKNNHDKKQRQTKHSVVHFIYSVYKSKSEFRATHDFVCNVTEKHNFTAFCWLVRVRVEFDGDGVLFI